MGAPAPWASAMVRLADLGPFQINVGVNLHSAIIPGLDPGIQGGGHAACNNHRSSFLTSSFATLDPRDKPEGDG